MKAQQLLFDAINHLPTGFNMEFDLYEQRNGPDGMATLISPAGEHFCFLLEIKHIHRKESLAWAKIQMESFQDKMPALLVCNRLTPALEIYCAENDINYIDSAGNARIQVPGFSLFVEGKQEKKRPVTAGRFPEGVMKLLFVLLSSPDVLNNTYRELAQIANISLGMVSKAFQYLETQKYCRKTKHGRRLMKEDELSILWVNSYASSLKPRLDQLLLSPPESWENLTLKKGEYPGGELAAASLSEGYLLPESGIIYTPWPLLQRRKELALNPSRDNGLTLISNFWGTYILNTKAQAMLCLAELLSSSDERNREVAGIINDKYLNFNQSALFNN